MKTYTRLFAHLALLAASCTALTGCVGNISPKITAATFPTLSATAGQRLPQKVAVLLPPEFSNYEQKLQRGFEGYSFHLGPALDAYAQSTAQSRFQTVQVVRGSEVPAETDVELVLTPSVRKAEVTSFVTIFDTQHLTVDVEWKLTRKGEAAPLWLETVEGSGEGKPLKPAVIESAIEDLWKKTVASFDKLRTLDALKAK